METRDNQPIRIAVTTLLGMCGAVFARHGSSIHTFKLIILGHLELHYLRSFLRANPPEIYVQMNDECHEFHECHKEMC